MKLSADISLEPKRVQALFELDRLIEQKLAARAAMATVYKDKASLATEILHAHRTPPEWLVIEAKSKGISVSALCQSILDRTGEAAASTLLLEEFRQRAKADVRAAISEQAITAAVEGFRGVNGV